ncbi:MAG TPA: class I SAM-dependent methyltransferase [Candidatus Nanopelagicales bacterium]|nr:class I SAM-dependent methyltransferase [Candidatus Nanopelagicales bacterium]
MSGVAQPFRSAHAPATLRRSLDLFSAFRLEQTRPDVFYSALARDAVEQIGAYSALEGATVLDVGAGPGWFRRAFEEAGARYLSIDADAGEMSAAALPQDASVLGDAMSLPFATGSVDVVFSSNVLEHVPEPERMADEMLRVAKPGGLVFLSYTLWYSPWGGHETSPWHYLGGDRAAQRYTRTHGHPPKNVYGESLYPLTAGRMLRWSRRVTGADVLAAIPRYHPWWAQWVMRVPGVRELASWNLLLVLRRR